MFKKSFLSGFFTVFLLLALCILPSASNGILSLGMQHISKDISIIKTCSSNEDIYFTKSDFTNALGIDDFSQITITSLPDVSNGTLKFGNMDAFSGQIITSQGIEYLRFSPSSSSEACSFTFSIDSKNDVKCMMYVINEKNTAPTGESFKINTICNIPIFSSMRGSDNENDELEYIIVSYPENGILQVKDVATGAFKYTPCEKFTGTDSFTYRVTDKYGNISDISTVTVKTEKNTANTVYADMADSPAAYAAMKLAEAGILVGEKIAENMYFSPNEDVKRSDFTVMAMKCANYSPNVYTHTDTGFNDDGEIPKSSKGYIVTAIKLGVDCRDHTKEENVFSPHDSITEADACRIVNSLIGKEGEDLASALITDGVIQTGNFGQESRNLSKENCALLLNYICSVKEN